MASCFYAAIEERVEQRLIEVPALVKQKVCGDWVEWSTEVHILGEWRGANVQYECNEQEEVAVSSAQERF